MDNRNMLCHQFVIDTTNEMKYFFDVLKNTYNIQNTSIEVISDIQELNMRIEHLKKLDTRIITKESLLKMIDYLSKTKCSFRGRRDHRSYWYDRRGDPGQGPCS